MHTAIPWTIVTLVIFSGSPGASAQAVTYEDLAPIACVWCRDILKRASWCAGFAGRRCHACHLTGRPTSAKRTAP